MRRQSGQGWGSVAYLLYIYTTRSLLTFPFNRDEEKIIEIAVEVGTDDVITNDDGSIDIITST